MSLIVWLPLLSHTLRGCVDWNISPRRRRYFSWVTPYVGVWIETLTRRKSPMSFESHPTWVCGLKLKIKLFAIITNGSHPTWVCGLKLFGAVATAWITLSHPTWVCGLKPSSSSLTVDLSQSHPTWVCGLKHTHGRLLSSLVDVTPYVGVWIETPTVIDCSVTRSHTLRGCVDWNVVLS